MSEVKVNMHIDAPEWALKFGFPEWMRVSTSTDVPKDADCVEPLLYDAIDGQAYQMFATEESIFKVKLEEQ